MSLRHLPPGAPQSHGALAARPLLLILAGYLILSIGLSLVLPLGEAADEVSHRGYVEEIARYGRLPDASGPAAGEAHQPPLYYVLVSGLTRWLPRADMRVLANPDFSLDKAFPPNVLLHPRAESFPYGADALAWHIMRLVSSLLGVLTIWATYRLAQAAVPGDPAVAIAAAGFVAFLPGFILLSAVLNNDNLITALAALTAWQWMRIVKKPPRFANAVLLGVLLGLAALSKLSGLLLSVVSAALFFYLLKRRGERRRWLLSSVLCFIFFAIIVSPLLVSNVQRFEDPLVWSHLLATWPKAATISLAGWWGYAVSMYTSFWGRFGGAIHIWLPMPVYVLLGIIPLLALIGLARVARGCRVEQAQRFTCHALLLFVACDLALLLSHIRMSAVVAGMDQARHVYPGLAPLSALIAVGTTRLWPQRRQAAAMLLVAAMCACAVFTIVSVMRTYSVPERAGEAIPGAAAADFGGRIRLLSSTIQQEPLSGGTKVLVTTSWQAIAPVDNVYWLLLRVLSSGAVVATADGVPASGLPTTDLWRPGDVYVSQHAITIPHTVPSGSYTVDIGLHPVGQWEWLHVQGQDTLRLGQVDVR